MVAIKRKLEALLGKYNGMSLPVKASIAYVLCSFFQRGISTLTTPIFTRLLTTEQYGYYKIFNSWLEIVAVFSTLKLSGSVFTQTLVKDEARRDEYTTSTAGLGTATTLLTMGIYLPLREYFNRWMGMTTFIMICIFLASWATLMFEIWAVRLRVQYKYKPLVFMTVVTSILKPLAGVVAILSTQEYKAEARIISLVAVEIIVYSGLFISFLRHDKRLFNSHFWRYSLSLNIPLIPHYLTRVVLNQSDSLMIKSMEGYSQAGIYGLGHNLAWLLTLVTTSLINTLHPWYFQKIREKQTHSIGNITYAVIAIVGVCGLGVTALAPEIVTVFGPKEYHEAIWVIPPLVASIFFMFMYNVFATFEYYYEKSMFLMVASTIGGVLNIILNYFCIKKFGYIAAGYTTLFCYIFYAVAHYICMKIIIRDHLNNEKILNLKMLLLLSAAYMACSTVMMATYKMWYLRYPLVALALVAVYFNRNRLISVLKEIRKKKKPAKDAKTELTDHAADTQKQEGTDS